MQGAEWTRGEAFNAYIMSTYPMQECLGTSDVACLDNAVSCTEYNYIYVSKILRVNNCGSLAPHKTFPYFVESLTSDANFEIVYETGEVLVSRRK